MRKILIASAGVLAFLGMLSAFPHKVCFAGETIARTAGPAMGYYFIVALEDPTPAMSKGRAIYSGVFMADGNKLNPVRDAYVKFIQEKYKYAQDPTTFNSSVQFAGMHSMEEAASIEQIRIKQGKDRNPEGTFETGWTYSA